MKIKTLKTDWGSTNKIEIESNGRSKCKENPIKNMNIEHIYRIQSTRTLCMFKTGTCLDILVVNGTIFAIFSYRAMNFQYKHKFTMDKTYLQFHIKLNWLEG